MKKLAIAMVLGVGCGGGDDEPPYQGLLEPPPAGEGLQIGYEVTLEPGRETTFCKFFPMPEGGIDVGKIEERYDGASHHVLIYATSYTADTMPQGVSENCLDDEETFSRVVGIVDASQQPSESIQFPPGIAYPLVGRLALLVEYHVLNTTDAQSSAEVAVNLWRAEGEITGEAGTLFYYHDLIAVPPMGSSSARLQCQVPEDLRLLTAAGHMHKRGVGLVAQATPPGGAAMQLLQVEGWADAPTKYFGATGTPIAAGTVIDFTCDYVNTSEALVVEGTSATRNEMCVFGGLYYRENLPRLELGQEMCRDDLRTVVYTGDLSCREAEACAKLIDWSMPMSVPSPDDQWEACVAQSCDGSYDAFEGCRWGQCNAECFPGGLADVESATCTACVASTCAAELAACDASVCP
jgi:hypothetical protein